MSSALVISASMPGSALIWTQRVALIGKGKDLVATRRKHASDDQSSRATGIDQSDAHARLSPYPRISSHYKMGLKVELNGTEPLWAARK